MSFQHDVQSYCQHHEDNQPANSLILFGGSFDPVHLGHMSIVRHLQQQLPDIPLHLLPTSGSPLKSNTSEADYRLAMLELAIHDLGVSAVVDQYEISQPPPIYTIETLIAYHKHSISSHIIYVIGSDNLLSLNQWYRYFELLDYCHLWVIPRQGLPSLNDSLSTSNTLITLLPSEWQSAIVDTPQALLHKPSGHIYIDDYVAPAISSSIIRDLIASGHNELAKPLLPQNVLNYIRAARLYNGL